MESQRAQVKTQYQSAIAQAIATNNLDKANALLAEAQRLDDSIVATAQQQASLNQNAQQTKTQQEQYNQQWQYGVSQDDYSRQLAKAQMLAQYGDFSGFAAVGYTPQEISAMQNYAPPLSFRGGSSSSSSSPSSANIFDELAQHQGAEATYLINKGYTASEVDTILAEYQGLVSQSETRNPSPFYEATGSYRYSEGAFTPEEYQKFLHTVGMNRGERGRASTVEDAYKEGKITESQAKALLDKYKIEYE